MSINPDTLDLSDAKSLNPGLEVGWIRGGDRVRVVITAYPTHSH